MPQFVIQRSLSDPGPHAGPLTDAERSFVPRAAGLEPPLELGPEVRWVRSYVTERKIYCLYQAPSADMLRAHARARGFPAEVIERVWSVSTTRARPR